MPKFQIESDDGRKFVVEGDTAPTQEEAAELFSQMPALTPAVDPGLTEQERNSIATRLRSKQAGQGPSNYLDTIIQGVADTALAGTPEAIAKRAGLDIDSPEAAKNINPQTYELAKFAGNFIPLGVISKGATATKAGVKELLKLGARIGGVYGAGQGISSVAKQDDPTLQEAVDQGIISGTTGAALGAAIPAAIAGGSRLGENVGTLLKQSADKSVQQALRPTTLEMKAKTERLTPQLLERPYRETIAATKKSLETKSEAQREIAGEAIGAFGDLKGDVDPQRIVNALEDVKQSYVVGGRVINPEAVARVEGVQEVFNQYGNSIPANQLREIYRSFGKEVAEGKGFTQDLAQGATLNLKKIASTEMRKVLAESNPDLTVLNDQFNFWANLNDVISATNKRTAPQMDFLGNLAGIAGATSAATIPGAVVKGVIMKGIFQAVRSPGWKLTSARIKNNIGDALIDNNPTKIINALGKIPGFNSQDLKEELGVIRSDNEVDSAFRESLGLSPASNGNVDEAIQQSIAP